MTHKRGHKEYFVRDAKPERPLPVKGYGALKGTIVFRKDIDLTRPIFEQVLTGDAMVKRNSAGDNVVDD